MPETPRPLQRVVETAPVPVYRIASDLRVTYVNAAGLVLAPLGVAVGLPVADLGFPPAVTDRLVADFRTVLATAAPLVGEVEIPLPDGTTGWSQYHFAPELGPAGRPVAVVGVSIDVTAARRAEAALRESERKYRMAVVGGRVNAWEFDLAGGATRVDPEFYEALGVDPATAPRTPAEWHAWHHPDDAPVIESTVADCLAGRTPGLEYEFRTTRPDGTVRWFLTRGQAVRGPDGAVTGLAGVTIDITDRKQADEALRASDARFGEFLANIPVPAWVHDADGRYMFVNPAYEQAVGVRATEWVGQLVRDVWPADIADRFLANDRQVIETGHAAQVTETAVAPDGQRRTWLNVKFPFHDAHGGACVGAVAVDLTDRVRFEEERRATERSLLQAQKLESLGVLAGGIAHDFNNILTAVLGYASLGRAHLPASDDGPLAEYLDQIERAARRAAELCQQMLAYSGRGQLVVRDLDLNRLVEEMAQLLTTVISKKAVLTFHLARDLPAIRGDATQLRQVIMNLLTNASDAIGDQSGVVTLTTGAIDADAKYFAELQVAEDLAPGRYVYAEVMDTGCGMTDEVKARIFEPFFTTKFTGRGLGLSAVQGIMRGHGGAIKVYSQPGAGTTVKVLFPARDVGLSGVMSAPAGYPAAFGRGRTVLVIDDEEDIRVFARKALESAGFLVVLAKDGREGVALFREVAADVALVLLDLTMPHVGGAEAFRQLRQARADVKVILTSGYNRGEATSGFEGQGLADFLRKPFRAQDLLALVFAQLGP